MSFSEKTETLVNALVQAEYENACLQAGKEFCDEYTNKYHSLYEGYAVLHEEIEEVKLPIDDLFGDMKGFWSGVKENNKLHCKDGVYYLLEHTQKAIKELAQVGAVLMKIKNTLGKDICVLTNDEVKE